MMTKNYNQSVEINHNLNWSYISDHPYRIIIIACSSSGKANMVLNLIKNQRPDVDKIYLHAKYSFKSKYQLFIKGREKVETKKVKTPKACIDYSQTTDITF